MNFNNDFNQSSVDEDVIIFYGNVITIVHKIIHKTFNIICNNNNNNKYDFCYELMAV